MQLKVSAALLAVVVSVPTVSLGIVACSSDAATPASGPTTDGGPNSETGAGDATLESACSAFADAQCERWDSCAPAALKTKYADLAACKIGEAKDCAFRTTANGTGWDIASRVACASALAKQSCDDLVDQRPVTECVKVGTLADGAGCADDAQCATGFCPTAFGSFCSTCQKLPKEGDLCIQDRCPGELYCRTLDPATAGSKRYCRAPVAQGADCDTTKPCLNTFACFNKKCVARAELDQPCDQKGISAPFCSAAHELECIVVGPVQKCRPLVYSQAKESCANDNELCAAAGYCADMGSGLACEAAAPEGGTCSITPECAPPFACQNQKCVAPDSALCP